MKSPALIRLLPWLAAGMLMAIATPTLAQSLSVDLGDGPSTTSRIVQIIALLTVLSLAPSILVMVTSFTRIIVVLSFLRNAMGVQQTPPNAVLISLALFLTAFVMMPTFEAAYDAGIKPLIEGEIEEAEAFNRTIVPFRRFMMGHVRDQDLALFINI
ncbi:MAG: flagellar biosynthetic protein FliP, partial [Alphaproteobacteria bacterium]